MARTGSSRWVAAALALVLGGCQATPSPVPSNVPSGAPGSAGAAPLPTRSLEPGRVLGAFDVGGYKLFIDCRGDGSPAVVIEAGLGSGPADWVAIQESLAPTSRTCVYARGGLPPSDARPAGTVPVEGITAGFMAEEERALLTAAGVDGPFVVVGHSYGGMIARLFAKAHPDETAGVVLVDASSHRQFEGQWLTEMPEWLDGPARVDLAATRAELIAIQSLGDTPLVVLTQGNMNGPFERDWSAFQDELAAMSTNSLHLVALDAGHMINLDRPAIVVESVVAVVEAARRSGALPACGARFEAVGADCVESTLTDRMQAWAIERGGVTRAAGSFPAGTYQVVVTREAYLQVRGVEPGFAVAEESWTFEGGAWSMSVVVDGGEEQTFEGIYHAAGDEITLLVPEELRTPMTSGVNTLRWSAAPDGTLTFAQIDDERPEVEWTLRFTPVPER